MRKKIYVVIAVLLVISYFIVDYLINIPVKEKYNEYYNKICSKQVEIKNLDEKRGEIFQKCKDTNGCWDGCKGCNSPRQHVNIVNMIIPKGCLAVCMPECVCSLGKKFDKVVGCR